MGCWVRVDLVNRDKSVRFSECEYETRWDTPGAVYKAMQSEYGRCVSKMYVDGGSSKRHMGWVFQKSERYEDTHAMYVQEAWVSLLEGPSQMRREEHLRYM